MKITRDAFLYLDPRGPKTRFAQCSTCRDWVSGDRRCVIHGPRVTVSGTMSCGVYIYGTPQPPGTATSARITPEESGLVDREVRCENCVHFNGRTDECELFRLLNEKMGDIFDLDIAVDEHGCCNAQTPS